MLELEPAPNRLVVFRTRDPSGPQHAVEQVREGDAFHRFGFTGYAMTRVCVCVCVCVDRRVPCKVVPRVGGRVFGL